MGFISRAWQVQEQIESQIASWPKLTLSTYLQFISMIFFIAGFGMFFYCILTKTDIIEVIHFHNPLFYLIMGFISFCFFLIERR